MIKIDMRLGIDFNIDGFPVTKTNFQLQIKTIKLSNNHSYMNQNKHIQESPNFPTHHQGVQSMQSTFFDYFGPEDLGFQFMELDTPEPTDFMEQLIQQTVPDLPLTELLESNDPRNDHNSTRALCRFFKRFIHKSKTSSNYKIHSFPDNPNKKHLLALCQICFETPLLIDWRKDLQEEFSELGTCNKDQKLKAHVLFLICLNEKNFSSESMINQTLVDLCMIGQKKSHPPKKKEYNAIAYATELRKLQQILKLDSI